MKLKPLFVLAALTFFNPVHAANWVGADVSTNGYGVHLGQSLISVPFLANVGVEGAAEKSWDANGENRYAAGLTVRDLSIPFTPVDAFATVGAEYQGSTHLYAEGGVRGPLLGPAGWRAFVRATTAKQLAAGLGVELRF